MLQLLTMIVALVGSGSPEPSTSARGLVVQDVFGRPLGERGLVLVDWEGYMANPAVRFFILPPPRAAYPATVVVRAREPLLMFDLPSEAGPHGPKKEIRLPRPEKTSLYVSIFPDRDSRDQDDALDVEFTDARGERQTQRVPVHVVDQDKGGPVSFSLTVDFTQDRTRFFSDLARQAVAVRAAEDWAYFFDGTDLAVTAAGAERTLIWNPDGFNTSRGVTNEKPYAGYLLYAYGIDSPLLRSGGEPSRWGGLQSQAGRSLPIRRSGGYEAEIKGNYNRKDWIVDLGDTEWWRATNLGGVANDLYSIAHHEIGHALVFNPGHLRFGVEKLRGRLRDEQVRNYLGGEPAIDRSDHLAGAIDPASLCGAFGNEYHGRMPRGRWLITKLDLLCAQAIGYKLRATSAFAPLTLRTETLPEAVVMHPYTAMLCAEGGLPGYDGAVLQGSLPDGVSLDSFSGELRGIPERLGVCEFTVRVRDSNEHEPGRSRQCRLKVATSKRTR